MGRTKREAKLTQERNEAKDDLRVTHEELRLWLTYSPAVLYKLKLENQTIVPMVISENVEQWFGVPAAETIQFDWWLESLHPDDRDRVLAETARGLERDGCSLEYRLRHRDGTYRWIHDSNRVLRDASGQPREAVGVWTDITERKKLEAEVASRQLRLDAFFTGATVGLALLDKDMRFVQVNDTLAEINGVAAQDHMGKTFRDILPQVAPMIEPLFQKVVETGEPILNVETSGETQNRPGTERHWVGSFFPIAGADGTLDTVGAVVVEITQHKQAEAALRESEERFRYLIEGSPDMIYISCEGKFAFINPAGLQLLGASCPEQVVGKPFMEFVHPDDREAVAARVASPELAPALEEKYLRLDGTAVDVEVIATPMIFQGKPAKQVIVRDITLRKRAEEAARLRAEEIRTLMDITPAAILTAEDPQCLRIVGNQTANRLLEAGENENVSRIGTGLRRFLHQGRELSNEELPIPKAAATGREIRDFEFDVVLPSGKSVTMWGNATPLHDAAGNVRGCIGAFMDITARKRVELALKEEEEKRLQMEKQLLQTQKLEAIGTLASGVAHEINNPIMGIMNYADLIGEKAGEDADIAKYAREIIRETERVATIVGDLLSFSRSDSQTHSPARMCDIVESTLSLVSAVMRRDQIHLEVNVPEDLPKLQCRSQQIQQVIMNLLTNARDALNEKYPHHDGNKRVSVTARMISKETRPWIRTTIEDHGPGIPDDIRNRIFDPFYTTKPRDKGSGLGLSVSHGIVKDHHGELSVESKVGEFTRFHLDLPVEGGWELEGQ